LRHIKADFTRRVLPALKRGAHGGFQSERRQRFKQTRSQHIFHAHVEQLQRSPVQKAQARLAIDHQYGVLKRSQNVFQFAARGARAPLRGA
jgi:hypothetical protein